MASKQKQTIDFGELPREGYVYSLYRGHIIRLGIVVLALMAVLAYFGASMYLAIYGCASALFGSRGALKQHSKKDQDK